MTILNHQADKLISLVGFAMKSRNLISGESLVVQSIQSNKAKVVLLAVDASKNTEKKITDKCQYYNVPIIKKFNRTTLGHAIGKDERVVIAITDDGFAKSMMERAQLME